MARPQPKIADGLRAALRLRGCKRLLASPILESALHHLKGLAQWLKLRDFLSLQF